MAVWAQGAGVVITPGSVQEGMPAPALETEPPPSQVVFPEPAPVMDLDPDGGRFVVNAFDIRGATVFSRRRLKRVMSRFLDLEVNLYDLNRAADDLTWYYHRRGYPLARAYVPAQTVTNGVVRIEVVEGRIGQVALQGQRRYDDDFLRARLPALRSGALVRGEALERDLLRLNALPGLRGRVILSPSAQAGATDALLELRETRVQGDLGVDNFGRAQTGRWRWRTGLALNSPMGWGDRFRFTGMKTQGGLIDHWALDYGLPLGPSGLRLNVSHSRVAYAVSGQVSALDVGGEVKTTRWQLGAPLISRRTQDSAWSLAYQRSVSMETALGEPLARYSLGLFDLGYRHRWTHPDAAQTQLQLQWASNLRGNPSGQAQDRVRTRVEVSVNHTAPWTKDWDVQVQAKGVYSPDTLPDNEKFSVGGPNSVPGFLAGEIRGDSGHVLRLALRRTVTWRERLLQWRVMADSGAAVYRLPGYRDTQESLRSVGLGTTWFASQSMQISVDWARAMGSSRRAADGRKSRVWMTAHATF